MTTNALDYRAEAHRLLAKLIETEGYTSRFWNYHHAIYDFEDFGAEDSAWRQVTNELVELTASA